MVERIGAPRQPENAQNPPTGRTSATGSVVPGTFQQLLQQQLQTVSPVRISAHAQMRLAQRRIVLGPAQLQRIQEAVDRAAAKGARESLILLDDLALVTSIRNRTIVTALSREEAKENVFTNIDSAVII